MISGAYSAHSLGEDVRGGLSRADHVGIHEEGDRPGGQPPGAQIVRKCEAVCGSEGGAHHLTTAASGE